MSFAFYSRLVVSSILLVVAAQPTEHAKSIMMRTEAKRSHVSNHVQENSVQRIRGWEAGQPLLPSPWFWFWGRPCRNKVVESRQLFEAAPELVPPSKKPYNLDSSGVQHSQWWQDVILEPILGKIGKGFFVESGAFNGEKDSNTLYYEMEYGWSGLLIEPSVRDFSQLLTKHRHAFAFHGCLSPDGQAKRIEYINGPPGWGKALKTETVRHMSQWDPDEDSRDWSLSESNAQPLHALLEAAGQSTVDFWSLDIEGSEGMVLLSTDFSKVEVGVLLIEMNKSGKNNDQIKEAMDNAGFKMIGHSYDDHGILDHIFINPQYFEKRNLEVPTAAVLEERYRDW